MPSYPWLVEKTLDGKDTAKKMSALRTLGVPYTDEDIAGAGMPFVARPRWTPWWLICKYSAPHSPTNGNA